MENKKVLAILCALFILMNGCTPSNAAIQTAIASTQLVWTQIPSQTSYPTTTPRPTFTPYPTQTQLVVVVTRVYVQTPTQDITKRGCVPITNMDYSNHSNMMILLQAYVSKLPGVRTVSYAIPEGLYSNVKSQAIYISYINDKDGKVYSKRFIVYMLEDPKMNMCWKTGVFSIDGQCWVDPLHYAHPEDWGVALKKLPLSVFSGAKEKENWSFSCKKFGYGRK